ncbi:MAG: hypothetical protein WCW56_03045 [Candidatus Paceibacterota bacterium]|jgi:molecular chaperone GrpE (heat shock protein)
MNERLKFSNEHDEARFFEWLEIMEEARNSSNEKSAQELLVLLDKKAKGEISDEELEKQSYDLGVESMQFALKEAFEKRGLNFKE